MFCPECGKELPEEATFCGYCGSEIAEGKSTAGPEADTERNGRSYQKNKNPRWKPIVLCGAAICFIAIGTLIFMSVGGESGRDDESMRAGETEALSDDGEEISLENDGRNAEADREAEAEKAESDKQPTDAENNAQTDEADKLRAGENILLDMNASEQKALNIFLSNFSEVGFASYAIGLPYENYWLIDFAFCHDLINNPSKIVYTDGNMGISAADVDSVLNRYFGRTVPHESAASSRPPEWTYRDGMFLTPAASGESYAFFSVATEMFDNDDGTYDVNFKVFFDDKNPQEAALAQWYSYTADEAEELCKWIGDGTAVIRPKKYNGKDTYEIVTYDVGNVTYAQ